MPPTSRRLIRPAPPFKRVHCRGILRSRLNVWPLNSAVGVVVAGTDSLNQLGSERKERADTLGTRMNALDLDTPSLYVDLDVLERNIRTMQARCREMGVGLRPHIKTHKIPEIARMQLAAGAVGLTVAKTGEAE